MTNPPDLTIAPLTPDRFGDLAQLFEEGGDPKWCWCTWFRFRGSNWGSTTASHREAMVELTARDRSRHPAPGLLAYRGDRAVGWVSLGPREDFDRLTHSKVLAPVDDVPVWSIVCFVVSRSVRGQGIAQELLDAAVSYARDRGAVALEAYPVDTGEGRVPDANAFHGTLSMFERAGFREVARRQWNATTPVRPIVRLELGRPGQQGRRHRPVGSVAGTGAPRDERSSHTRAR
ncbi:MAG: GNAT family N-acetyltransferase [Candidatus Limnocylindrales bacterium]